MNNYKLSIQYDGHKYNGWQKQGNTDSTIQGILEDTISKYLSALDSQSIPIELNGSGRTDAGVHADGQVANFKTDLEISIDDFLTSINVNLPKDIRVFEAEKVDISFHARLSATGKFYSYYIDNGDIASVFKKNYNLRVEEPLNLGAMRLAASFLEGEHDFISFCAKTDLKKSTTKTIYDIKITSENGLIRICFHGNGFLYNMVRILSGTLIEIGTGKMSPGYILEILAKKDRNLAGPTVSGNALFLDKVEYHK